jgi:hypothetical protein
VRSPGRVVPLLAMLFLLGLAPAAEAKLRAKTSVTTKAGVARIAVKLTSTTRLTASTRPRRVSVKAGRTVYKLKRVRGAGVAAVSAGTWRSKGYRGTAAARLRALQGKRVTVRVGSDSGTTSLKSRVAVPTGGGGGGGGGGPLFAPPGSELEGQAAYDHFRGYFENSRFTDCPAGWPNCAVEERYNHCPDGSSWEYHRLTPTSGSDINSYGSYQVTGAVAHADGSWAVEYVVTAYGSQSFYHWEVATDGTVLGTYWAPGNAPPNPPDQQLGPLRWQQPAGCS